MLSVSQLKKKMVFKLYGLNHLIYMNNTAKNSYLKLSNFYQNLCCDSFDNHNKAQ